MACTCMIKILFLYALKKVIFMDQMIKRESMSRLDDGNYNNLHYPWRRKVISWKCIDVIFFFNYNISGGLLILILLFKVGVSDFILIYKYSI